MQKLLTFTFLCFIWSSLSAQHEPIQPYEDLGIKVKVLTLSNGKYQESFPNDTLQPIGSVMFNRVTGEIVTVLERDTSLGEYSLKPTVSSRWLSPDPLAAEFPEWSPYNFVLNNPIRYIDPDGMAPEDPIVKNGKLVGYRVEAGQGPTQIASDLNSIETQLAYGYILENTQASYLDIVDSNPGKFEQVGDVNDVNDSGFKALDVNLGDEISLSTLISREEGIGQRKTEISMNDKSITKIDKTVDSLEGVKDGQVRSYNLSRDHGLQNDKSDPGTGLGIVRGLILDRKDKEIKQTQNNINRLNSTKDSLNKANEKLRQGSN